MNDFLLNLARRSAGVGTPLLVEPSRDPVFSPTPGETETNWLHPDFSSEQTADESISAVPTGLAKQSLSPSGEDVAPDMGGDESSPRLFDLRETKPTSIHYPDVPSSTALSPFSLESQAENVQATARQSVTVPSDTNDRKSTSEPPVVPHQSGSMTVPPDINRRDQVERFSTTTPTVDSSLWSTGPTSRPNTSTMEETTTSIQPDSAALESSALLSGIHEPQPQPVQVRIGTIEVRAEQMPAVRASKSTSQNLIRGFDDYKFIR
jgi:hypothetical protein